MTPEQLKTVLDLHAKWLRGEGGGARADLSSATLSYADLRGADLRNANLRGANLRGAGLRADLSHADLRGADLRGADMCSADLRHANLRGADLRGADLRHANLSGANLCGADLRYANLAEADLRGADLCHASLPVGYRIASLCFGGWPVTVTPTQTTIGCQSHPNEFWLSADEDAVHEMHVDAAAWWKKHKAAVCAVIRDVMEEA